MNNRALLLTTGQFIAKAFNLAVLNKKRLVWVDYLRGIAIILVVYRHALIGIENSGIFMPQYLITANMIFFSFRIPLFFIVSGLFIAKSIHKKGIREIIVSKFDLLFYPYLIWAIIQITLQIFLSHYSNASRDMGDYLYILYQPRSIDQFWYLPALFNVSIVYILTRFKLKLKPVIQIILGLIFYFTSFKVREISMLSDWMEFYVFFAIGDLISTVFFKDHSQKFLASNNTLISVLPVFVFTQLFYLKYPEDFYSQYFSGQALFLIIALIGCFCVFALAFQLEKRNIFSFLRVVGYHSLYIYVLHVLAAAVCRTLLIKIGVLNPALLLVLCIVFGVIAPILFYNFFVNNKFAWFLFSFRKNKNTPSVEKIN